MHIREIDRKVEDIGCAEFIASHALPGLRGRRDHHAIALLTKLHDHLCDRQHLAHAYGVNPGHRKPGSGILLPQSDARRDDAEPFDEPGAVFAQAQHLHQPPGQGECQQ